MDNENFAVKKVLDKIIDVIDNNENIENNQDLNIKKKEEKKKKRKKKKNRCSFDGCNKKLKLTDFPCRCKKIFCVKHRMQESHNCVELKKNMDKKDFIERCGLGGGVASKLTRI